MIVSHRHKFIFLKTRKTAGTSMEIALSKFCGPRDILTPIGPKDEQIRRELGYRGVQNRHLQLSLASLRYLWEERRLRYHNHVAAQWVRATLGEAVWETYFKFCIERNPWDKAVSLYYWRTRHDPENRPPLIEFLTRVKHQSLSNYYIYSLDGELAVDRILRYEDLDAELVELQERLGLPETPRLPRAKASIRKDRRHYTALMGEDERALIAMACAPEIALLDYRFDEEGRRKRAA